VDGTGPRRPRWARALVAGFVAFELVAAGVLVARDTDDPVTTTGAKPASAGPTPDRPRQGAADRSAVVRANAVTDLLERRARAIRRRDRTSFTATLDVTQRAFVTRQLKLFDALAEVPLAEWRYDLVTADEATPPQRKYGAAETWAPRVTLRYRLTGYDTSATAADQYLTFVRRGTRWLVADDADFDEDGRRTARDIWDFGPVSVVRGVRSLVLGHPGQHSFLRDVARHADDAVPRVSRVWGTSWSRKVVVVVPATDDELGAIIGDDGDLSRIAAVAVAELPGDTGNRPVGNRVIVNPPNFRRLGNLGRRVVLTHEVTHVATRDDSAVGVPTWLVEGFADYVGYLGTGLSARAICQELAADVRAGRAPRQLPHDGDFDGGNDKLAQAYESAWLAVHLVVERAGEDGLVDLYRRAATRPLPEVLKDVTGLTVERFLVQWRAYVKATLG